MQVFLNRIILVIGITYGIMKSLSTFSVVQFLGVKDSEKMSTLTDFMFALGEFILFSLKKFK